MGETWILELVPLADPIPVEIRMRRLLKFALRAVGFRCRAYRVQSDQDGRGAGGMTDDTPLGAAVGKSAPVASREQ